MRGFWLLVVLVACFACQQLNPDWDGPASTLGDDGGSMDAADGSSVDSTANGPGMPECGNSEQEKLCGNQCTNIWTNRRNCGDCDVSCEPGEQCQEGVCQ